MDTEQDEKEQEYEHHQIYPIGSLFYSTIPENPSNYTNIHGKWILKETISRESKGKIYIYEKVAEEDMKFNDE